MVLHCLRDDFRSFLDREQYFLNATVFDAIGLRPGAAPRERRLIGHRLYSEMTAGVGRGTIFNHRDPLGSPEDLEYLARAVERFRLVLQRTAERKMFVILNLNKQLWVEEDIRAIFDELCVRTDTFDLVAVDCVRNLGRAATGASAEELVRETRHGDRGVKSLLVYRFPCIGDNTGSYFREDADAERLRAL
eukprot:CAMPEP_0198584866 /NCGR_PEP_ID=MMETSP1462-20131121/128571_1 /TAXON_ID=1333877 /ORGANISM="Brandtodinium nutriculum, Strain RCC3387" /LENGTH=190 /DNA_ID=CAMNT_0044316287 /DNA_START=62 /DNA_END=630 /DNA_ORIENTATION=-